MQNQWRSSLFATWISIGLIFTYTQGIAEEYRYDLRSSIDQPVSSVTISGINRGRGHAFIVLNYEDDVHKRTYNKAVGFYSDEDAPRIEAWFGHVGQLKDEPNKADVKVIVMIDRDKYLKATRVLDKYKSPTRYILGINDCTSLALKIADAVGLQRAPRPLYPFPVQFVQQIADLNRESALDNEAKLSLARAIRNKDIKPMPMPIIDLEKLEAQYKAQREAEERQAQRDREDQRRKDEYNRRQQENALRQFNDYLDQQRRENEDSRRKSLHQYEDNIRRAQQRQEAENQRQEQEYRNRQRQYELDRQRTLRQEQLNDEARKHNSPLPTPNAPRRPDPPVNYNSPRPNGGGLSTGPNP